MNKGYDSLFKNIEVVTPRKELYEAILTRIALERRRIARFRFVLLGSVALGSLGAIITCVVYLVDALTKSGFMQYVSLVFSEQGALTYWKEIGLSLAESLPLFALMAVLSSLAIFLWSASKATSNVRAAFLPA